ncbi:MAG TPA: carboxypeptidase-like regulatory domain-containing protein [Longimicrobiaceae bacterium]
MPTPPRRSAPVQVPVRKRLGAVAVALAAALAAAVPAFAQGARESSPVPLSGQVTDRGTGQPLAGAYVELAGTRLEALTDDNGRFSFKRVRPGEHTLSVSLLGYADQERTVQVAQGQADVAVALEPDAVVLEGLTVNLNVLEQRRNRVAVSSRAFDREQIRRSAAINMESFVRGPGGVPAVSCRRAFADACVYSRGRYEPVAVYLDEMPIHSLEHLASLQPSEVERVEVYQHGRQIRVYTSWFMDKLARGKTWVNPAFMN